MNFQEILYLFTIIYFFVPHIIPKSEHGKCLMILNPWLARRFLASSWVFWLAHKWYSSVMLFTCFRDSVSLRIPHSEPSQSILRRSISPSMSLKIDSNVIISVEPGLDSFTRVWFDSPIMLSWTVPLFSPTALEWSLIFKFEKLWLRYSFKFKFGSKACISEFGK